MLDPSVRRYYEMVINPKTLGEMCRLVEIDYDQLVHNPLKKTNPCRKIE